MRAAALGLLLAVAACAHPQRSSPSSGGAWRIEVDYHDGALDVRTHFPAGTLGGEQLAIDRGHAAHVDALTAVHGDGTPAPITADGDGWTIEGCETQDCTLGYRFDLQGSAGSSRRSRGDMSAVFDARAREGMFASPPSRWLIRSPSPPRGTRFELRVRTREPERFVTGLTPGDRDDTFTGWAGLLGAAPYSAFGRLEVRTFEPPGGRVQVALPLDVAFAERPALLAWTERAVEGVAHYLGRFPVRHAAIIIVPTGGEGVHFGAARGNGGASVQVLVGPHTRDATFRDDWVLVHELAHLGLPNLPRTQHWWEEGLATYLEIMIRVRLGLRTEEEAWTELAEKLPLGLLAPGDGGYNHSGSWAHTYWGGALFCWLADVRIRERTQGAHTLADALRGVEEAGGSIATSWSPEEVIRVADAATGVPVLAELWRDLAEGERPEVDLEGLLRRLGVSIGANGQAQLDDSAPAAALRRALMRDTVGR